MPIRPKNKGDGGSVEADAGAASAKVDDAETRPQPAGATPTISSETLLAGRSEVQIHHRGEIYRLTLTRAGKLILHK